VSAEERLRELLQPLIRGATVLEARASRLAEEMGASERFGGAPYAEAGDEWPLCSGCGGPMTFVAQLVERDDGRLLVFFYCFRCNPWGLEDEAPGMWAVRAYSEAAVARCVRVAPPAVPELELVPCVVAARDVSVLPDWDGVEVFAPDATELCQRIDANSPWEAYSAGVLQLGCLDDFATLVGGYPRWVQGESAQTCPECGAALDFVAQIDSEQNANLMWGDAGLVYLFRCPTHRSAFALRLQCF
jgi:Domain of unknown function (DUF1963)